MSNVWQGTQNCLRFWLSVPSTIWIAKAVSFIENLMLVLSPIRYEMIFGLKALRRCGFGFAAGCAAVAMPRRRGAFYIFGLCP